MPSITTGWFNSLPNYCYYYFNSFIYLFGCAGSLLLCKLFSGYGKQGLLSSCCTWASNGMASLVADHGLWSICGLSSCSFQVPEAQA